MPGVEPLVAEQEQAVRRDRGQGRERDLLVDLDQGPLGARRLGQLARHERPRMTAVAISRNATIPGGSRRKPERVVGRIGLSHRARLHAPRARAGGRGRAPAAPAWLRAAPGDGTPWSVRTPRRPRARRGPMSTRIAAITCVAEARAPTRGGSCSRRGAHGGRRGGRRDDLGRLLGLRGLARPSSSRAPSSEPPAPVQARDRARFGPGSPSA